MSVNQNQKVRQELDTRIADQMIILNEMYDNWANDETVQERELESRTLLNLILARKELSR